MMGTELWLSNGTASGTNLVQDITPGPGSSFLDNLVSAGKKLYFVKDDGWFSTLWSADCSGNVNPVADPGLNDLHYIQALTVAGRKLFFNAYTQKYGTELYAGNVGNDENDEEDKSSFTSLTIIQEKMMAKGDDSKFSVKLYPNPVNSLATLMISGASPETSISITDMKGNLIWQGRYVGVSIMNLPAEKLASGVYIITVKSGLDNKIIKMVKQ
jgi:ELWxxDGT repeat protein